MFGLMEEGAAGSSFTCCMATDTASGPSEGELARGGLVQHDAQRVDVAGGREIFALGLFRRDVVGGAQHSGRFVVQRESLRPGDAEVHHLHVAIGLHHDVLRFDVAVDDVLPSWATVQRLCTPAAPISAALRWLIAPRCCDRGLQVGTLRTNSMTM